jgi:hypothetical protein
VSINSDEQHSFHFPYRRLAFARHLLRLVGDDHRRQLREGLEVLPLLLLLLLLQGVGNHQQDGADVYSFILTMCDNGEVDTSRLKIWLTAGDSAVIYNNQR